MCINNKIDHIVSCIDIETMKNFYFDMNPDIDMCYDYICEVADCSSFVADKEAWDMFYDAWDSTQELDD